jgi:hypothetical protein
VWLRPICPEAFLNKKGVHDSAVADVDLCIVSVEMSVGIHSKYDRTKKFSRPV